MYYFKSDPRQVPLNPNTWGFFSNKTVSSCDKPNLNTKNTQTAPLILLVNLLMKHGKKTHALRILSKTLYLFKAKISKIKLENNASKDYSKKKPFAYYQKIQYLKKESKNKQLKSNISVPYTNENFSPMISWERDKNSFNPKVDFFGHIKTLNLYSPVFPFFYNKKVFRDFYLSKNFFHGKFLSLNHSKIQPEKEHLRNRESLGVNRGVLYLYPFNLNFMALSEGTVPDKRNTSFLKKTSSNSNCSKKYLWYKTPVKNSSWDLLTVPQKNTFLYCLYKAISNVKPPLECRTKRLGGSNKQIPSQISEKRQWGIAIRWIIEAAKTNFSKKKVETYKKGFRPVVPLQQTTKSSQSFIKLKYPRNIYEKNKYLSQSKEASLQDSSLLELSKAFLKESSSKTKFYRFCFSLAESLEHAYYKKGPAMQKRNLWVEAALNNRAFLRYRWW